MQFIIKVINHSITNWYKQYLIYTFLILNISLLLNKFNCIQFSFLLLLIIIITDKCFHEQNNMNIQEIEAYVFAGKYEFLASPYSDHLFKVAEKCVDESTKVFVLLQDLLENSPTCNVEKLLKYFPRDIVADIGILSKQTNQSYEEYMCLLLYVANNVGNILSPNCDFFFK